MRGRVRCSNSAAENLSHQGGVYRRRKNQPEVFLPEVFFAPLWGHGHPRVWVMDVRAQMLVSARFRGPARSLFLTWAVHTNDPGTSAGYPARKLSLWAVLLFLSIGGLEDKSMEKENRERKST